MPILPDDRTSVSWKVVDGRMLGSIFLTRPRIWQKRLWGFSDVRGPVIGEIKYKGPASGTVDVGIRDGHEMCRLRRAQGASRWAVDDGEREDQTLRGRRLPPATDCP